MSDGKEFLWGTGRRKTSVARVRIQKGKGKILVNKRPFEEFFPQLSQREMVLLPLQITNVADQCDVYVNANGGGISGQAGAIILGIARALCKIFPHTEEKLRAHGFLTRDGRMKERKKYGRRGARASFQFSKR